MFLNRTAILIFLLLSSTTLADDIKHIDEMKILGKWCSVKLEGDDIGNHIVEIRAEFQSDQQVTLTAKLKSDGKVKENTRTGTYKIVAKDLEMNLGPETMRQKAWFEKGLLVIQDPELDARVHLERVMDEQ